MDAEDQAAIQAVLDSIQYMTRDEMKALLLDGCDDPEYAATIESLFAQKDLSQDALRECFKEMLLSNANQSEEPPAASQEKSRKKRQRIPSSSSSSSDEPPAAAKNRARKRKHGTSDDESSTVMSDATVKLPHVAKGKSASKPTGKAGKKSPGKGKVIILSGDSDSTASSETTEVFAKKRRKTMGTSKGKPQASPPAQTGKGGRPRAVPGKEAKEKSRPSRPRSESDSSVEPPKPNKGNKKSDKQRTDKDGKTDKPSKESDGGSKDRSRDRSKREIIKEDENKKKNERDKSMSERDKTDKPRDRIKSDSKKEDKDRKDHDDKQKLKKYDEGSRDKTDKHKQRDKSDKDRVKIDKERVKSDKDRKSEKHRDKERVKERDKERTKERDKEPEKDRTKERDKELEKERQKERDRELEKERQKERDRELEKERQKERDRELEKERQKERDKELEKERQKERDKELEKERQKERDKELEKEHQKERDKELEKVRQKERDKELEKERQKERDKELEKERQKERDNELEKERQKERDKGSDKEREKENSKERFPDRDKTIDAQKDNDETANAIGASEKSVTDQIDSATKEVPAPCETDKNSESTPTSSKIVPPQPPSQSERPTQNTVVSIGVKTDKVDVNVIDITKSGATDGVTVEPPGDKVTSDTLTTGIAPAPASSSAELEAVPPANQSAEEAVPAGSQPTTTAAEPSELSRIVAKSEDTIPVITVSPEKAKVDMKTKSDDDDDDVVILDTPKASAAEKLPQNAILATPPPERKKTSLPPERKEVSFPPDRKEVSFPPERKDVSFPPERKEVAFPPARKEVSFPPERKEVSFPPEFKVRVPRAPLVDPDFRRYKKKFKLKHCKVVLYDVRKQGPHWLEGDRIHRAEERKRKKDRNNRLPERKEKYSERGTRILPFEKRPENADLFRQREIVREKPKTETPTEKQKRLEELHKKEREKEEKKKATLMYSEFRIPKGKRQVQTIQENIASSSTPLAPPVKLNKMTFDKRRLITTAAAKEDSWSMTPEEKAAMERLDVEEQRKKAKAERVFYATVDDHDFGVQDDDIFPAGAEQEDEPESVGSAPTDTPPPPIKECEVNEMSTAVLRILLTEESIQLADMADTTVSHADAIMLKCGKWFRGAEKEPYYQACPSIPENHEEKHYHLIQASLEANDDDESFIGNVSNPDGEEDDLQDSEITSTALDPDQLDEFCGAALLNAKLRIKPGETPDCFQNILQVRRGCNYDKANFQAKCNLCDEHLTDKRQLGAHIRSAKHRNSLAQTSLNVIGMSSKQKDDSGAKSGSKTSDKSESSRRESSISGKEERGKDKREINKIKADLRRKGSVSSGTTLPRSREESSGRRHRSRSRSPRRIRRSRSRSRSPYRRPSHRRSRSPSPRGRHYHTHHNRRSRTRSRSPVHRRRSSRERADDYGGRKRSRSPKGGVSLQQKLKDIDTAIFKEKLTLEATGKWTTDLQSRWKLKEDDEADLKRMFAQKRKKLEEKPEEHPLYADEWTNFWERRYQELTDQGEDAESYDYTPDWKIHWKKFSEDFLEREFADEMEAIRKKYSMDLETLRRANLEPAPVQGSRSVPPPPPPVAPGLLPQSPMFHPAHPLPPMGHSAMGIPPPMGPVPGMYAPPVQTYPGPPGYPPVVPPAHPYAAPPFPPTPVQPPIHASLSQPVQPPAHSPVVQPQVRAAPLHSQAHAPSSMAAVGAGSSNPAGQNPPGPEITRAPLMAEDYSAKSMSISSGSEGARKPPAPKVTIDDVKNTWLSYTGQKISAAVVEAAKSVASNASSGKSQGFDYDGLDVVQVLRLMLNLEDELSFLAHQVKCSYREAEKLEAEAARKSFSMLKDPEFVTLLQQCRDKFYSILRANVSTSDVMKKLNLTTFALNALLESSACQKLRPAAPLPPPAERVTRPPSPPPPARNLEESRTNGDRPTPAARFFSNPIAEALAHVPQPVKVEISSIIAHSFIAQGKDRLSQSELMSNLTSLFSPILRGASRGGSISGRNASPPGRPSSLVGSGSRVSSIASLGSDHQHHPQHERILEGGRSRRRSGGSYGEMTPLPEGGARLPSPTTVERAARIGELSTEGYGMSSFLTGLYSRGGGSHGRDGMGKTIPEDQECAKGGGAEEALRAPPISCPNNPSSALSSGELSEVCDDIVNPLGTVRTATKNAEEGKGPVKDAIEGPSCSSKTLTDEGGLIEHSGQDSEKRKHLPPGILNLIQKEKARKEETFLEFEYTRPPKRPGGAVEEERRRKIEPAPVVILEGASSVSSVLEVGRKSGRHRRRTKGKKDEKKSKERGKDERKKKRRHSERSRSREKRRRGSERSRDRKGDHRSYHEDEAYSVISGPSERSPGRGREEYDMDRYGKRRYSRDERDRRSGSRDRKAGSRERRPASRDRRPESRDRRPVSRDRRPGSRDRRSGSLDRRESTESRHKRHHRSHHRRERRKSSAGDVSQPQDDSRVSGVSKHSFWNENGSTISSDDNILGRTPSVGEPNAEGGEERNSTSARNYRNNYPEEDGEIISSSESFPSEEPISSHRSSSGLRRISQDSLEPIGSECSTENWE